MGGFLGPSAQPSCHAPQGQTPHSWRCGWACRPPFTPRRLVLSSASQLPLAFPWNECPEYLMLSAAGKLYPWGDLGRTPGVPPYQEFVFTCKSLLCEDQVVSRVDNPTSGRDTHTRCAAAWCQTRGRTTGAAASSVSLGAWIWSPRLHTAALDYETAQIRVVRKPGPTEE